jgi:hypothetical protein
LLHCALVVNGTEQLPDKSLWRSLLGEQRTSAKTAQNDAVDPSRHFATIICRSAKAPGQLSSLAGQGHGRTIPLADMGRPFSAIFRRHNFLS